MTVAPKRIVVAIDGPAGAGKSTVTRLLADELGYTRVDTGALYRTVAWLAHERGVSLDDSEGLARVASELTRPGALEFRAEDGLTRVVALERDISEEIRAQEIGAGASRVSQFPGVRAALLEMQRSLGRNGGVVLEGRDIGTVVFPSAEVKFFLTASVRVRAARRLEELAERGQRLELEQVMTEVRDRDRRDTERPVAPLAQAPDAVVVDSSEMTLEQVVAHMARIVRVAERS